MLPIPTYSYLDLYRVSGSFPLLGLRSSESDSPKSRGPVPAQGMPLKLPGKVSHWASGSTSGSTAYVTASAWLCSLPKDWEF